jgi:hypothetical protein
MPFVSLQKLSRKYACVSKSHIAMTFVMMPYIISDSFCLNEVLSEGRTMCMVCEFRKGFSDGCIFVWVSETVP